MTWLSRKVGQFAYFSQQLGEPDWSRKDVLDFGGNIGNMLRDEASTIDEERYWCIDVDSGAIEEGRAAYPRANWLSYDRYCFFFNPTGVPGLGVPRLSQQFDFIVAYSVFTNTRRDDMFELVEQLRAMLKEHGRLAFTFIDPHYNPWPGEYGGNNLRWRLEKKSVGNKPAVVDRLMEQSRNAEWCVVVNGTDLYVEREDIVGYATADEKSYHVFCSEAHMRYLFPRATILPPVNDEMQHCCILNREP